MDNDSLTSRRQVGVTRCDLIRVLGRLCVKCADSVGAGVMLRQERVAAPVLFGASRLVRESADSVGAGVMFWKQERFTLTCCWGVYGRRCETVECRRVLGIHLLAAHH